MKTIIKAKLQKYVIIKMKLFAAIVILLSLNILFFQSENYIPEVFGQEITTNNLSDNLSINNFYANGTINTVASNLTPSDNITNGAGSMPPIQLPANKNQQQNYVVGGLCNLKIVQGNVKNFTVAFGGGKLGDPQFHS